MAFRTLATPEPLLKRGYFLEFIGDWGEHYKERFYRIKFLAQFERNYRKGYLPLAATTPLVIDPKDDMGFEPKYYDTLYQVRIGINHGWNMYLQWPTGDYRGKLEDPTFAVINPVASDDKKFIGLISAAKPLFGTAGGILTSLVSAALTSGPTVPYDQTLWINRIEISNHVTTDVRIVGYDTFTDTDGNARSVQFFDYKLVSGQTIGVDVEKSKKVLNLLKFQATEGTPTALLPVTIWLGGEFEAPKLNRFFEFMFVKDWMPAFHASVSSILDYEKIILSCLVNKLKIEPVMEPAIRAKLQSGELPSYPLWHYSQYESLSI